MSETSEVVCSICGKNFKDKAGLAGHMRLAHSSPTKESTYKEYVDGTLERLESAWEETVGKRLKEQNERLTRLEELLVAQGKCILSVHEKLGEPSSEENEPSEEALTPSVEPTPVLEEAHEVVLQAVERWRAGKFFDFISASQQIVDKECAWKCLNKNDLTRFFGFMHLDVVANDMGATKLQDYLEGMAKIFGVDVEIVKDIYDHVRVVPLKEKEGQVAFEFVDSEGTPELTIED